MTRPQPKTRRSRTRRQPRLEGMTLIEIMIVVIIMALIATAVGVAVLPQLDKARIKSTRTDAQTIRSAVTLYLADHPSERCPTIDDLISDAALDRSKRTTDAWEREFQVQCDGSNVDVLSAGPDGQFGSEDDIQ